MQPSDDDQEEDADASNRGPTAAAGAAAPGLKIDGLRMPSFTRIDSPVKSRVTAQRDEAASNERNVAREPYSSGRETKLPSSTSCPTEKRSWPAAAAGGAVEGEVGGAEGVSEAPRRGERSREGLFSSTRAVAAAGPGTKAGACGDNSMASAGVATAAAGTTSAAWPPSTAMSPGVTPFFFLRVFLRCPAAGAAGAAGTAGGVELRSAAVAALAKASQERSRRAASRRPAAAARPAAECAASAVAREASTHELCSRAVGIGGAEVGCGSSPAQNLSRDG